MEEGLGLLVILSAAKDLTCIFETDAGSFEVPQDDKRLTS